MGAKLVRSRSTLSRLSERVKSLLVKRPAFSFSRRTIPWQYLRIKRTRLPTHLDCLALRNAVPNAFCRLEKSWD
jgi:CMP-2-keto-3-deoxyoctulosonic acid synthetase